MASRKLVRDLFFSAKQPLYRHLLASQQVLASTTRLRLIPANRYPPGVRQFGVFNEFSMKVKGEANRNENFQHSVKELKQKAEELKVVKEDLKVRTKQTTEKLYKHVDGVWTEAEATAKKVSSTLKERVSAAREEVSSNLKEKVSAATEEVKENLGIGKRESSGSSGENGSNANYGSKSASGENKQQEHGPSDTPETLFSKFKSGVSSISPKVSLAFQKLKEAKPIDLAKKGYDIVKDELNGNSMKRKRIEYSPSTAPSMGERSTRTDVVVLPSKQSRLSKKWAAFKEKMQGYAVYKRVTGLSKPVVEKSQEIAEDIRDRWDTSDHPVVMKIQDINESVFGETAAAVSVKEIRRRDPDFSLPEFVAEVQEVVKPVLTAYYKGDTEVLKKFCCPEVIERCKAEHKAFKSHGIFFDNKILHISEADVRETKLMGDTPVIIVVFQTQQIHCVRDREGSVTEGGEDTIHTVFYAWAMQLIPPEELGEGAIYPVWRLREMQQMGHRALI